MRARVKELLQPIVNEINKESADGIDIFNILTALRGPDNNDRELKNRTTATIRGAIGLKQNLPFTVSYEPLPELNWAMHGTHEWHFITHVKMAVEAIKHEK